MYHKCTCITCEFRIVAPARGTFKQRVNALEPATIRAGVTSIRWIAAHGRMMVLQPALVSCPNQRLRRVRCVHYAVQ
eukprot:COSAG02_NODE_7462_length_3001_cov_1.468987_4_plen_77_part_00